MTLHRTAQLLTTVTAIGLWPMVARAAIEHQNLPENKEETEEPPPAPVLTKPPELVEFKGAEYPPDLLYRGVGGEVTLYIDIDERGLVSRVQVVKASDPGFAMPAMVAATQFRFTPAEIDYAPAPIRIEYRYVFTPKLPEPDAIAGLRMQHSEESNAPVNFRGLVREAGNRNPIAGAVVYLFGRPVAETDSEGRFELRGVPSGTVELKLTSPYHDSYSVEETLADNEVISANYYLVRTSRNPYETTIRTKAKRREVSKVQLSRKEVSKVPGTSGDPIRVIENLPGTARPPAGIGALIVRGSNPSDSAVFLDGVEIPLLYHFGGLTSVINATFLEEINFYPGGFGARFGRAIAGVVDVKSRDIDCDKWRGTAQWSNLEGHLYSCLKIDDWTVAGAVRRSFVDLILPYILQEAVPRREDEGVLTATPSYLDYQIKAHRRSGNHNFDVFAFGSDDRLKVVQINSQESLNFDFGLIINWHRLMLRDRYQLGPNTTITTAVTPGVTSSGFVGSTEDLNLHAGTNAEVWSLAWREDVTHKFNDMFTLNAGVDFQIGQGRFTADLPIPTDVLHYPTPTFDITAVQSFRREFGVFNHGYWAELVFETPFKLQIVRRCAPPASPSSTRAARSPTGERRSTPVSFLAPASIS